MHVMNPRVLVPARIVTVALCLASAAYVMVFLTQARFASPPPPPDHARTFAFVLAGLGATLLVAAPFVRTALMARGPRTVQAWFAAFIVAQALRESVAVFGLIASFETHDKRWVIGCAVAAVAAMLLAFPMSLDLDTDAPA